MKFAQRLGFAHFCYDELEAEFVEVARAGNIEPWALDRLLFGHTKHYLAACA